MWDDVSPADNVNKVKESFKDKNDIFVSILCTGGRGMLIIVLLEYCTSISRI